MDLQAADHETRLEADDHFALKLWLRILTCSNLIEARIRHNLRHDFDCTLPRFDLMAQRWGAIESRAIDARQVRQARVNVANLKASGILSAKETYIANRLIDENITRALPSRLQYLKSGGRLALFEPQDARLKVAIAEIQQLESEFWRVMTYDNWEMDYIKAFDGSELLGWDWVEVAYDESRPGHVNVSHVGNDYLIFDQTIQSLQESSIVGRQYLLSEVRLRALAKANSFNETVVAEVMEKLKVDTSQNGVLITHFFFKTADGLVSHGWYYKTSSRRNFKFTNGNIKIRWATN
jgi:hypothetical protein